MKKYVEDLDFQGEENIRDWPPWSPQDIRRKKGVLAAARMMVNSAMTAPVAGCVPQVETEIIYGEDIVLILEVIEPVAKAARYVQWDYQTIKGL